MKLTFNKLQAMSTTVTRRPLPRWMRRAGAGALTLAIAGLESWLRVPVQPVLEQIWLSRCPARA
jgi:hypothetical protein